MVAIIDYGVGNLFSLQSSFGAIGEAAEVTADPETIRRAERVILPGVGAFEDAARKLRASAWVCRCCLNAAGSMVAMKASAC